MTNTVLCRIPRPMYNEIKRIKNQMEREHKTMYGRKKSVTMTKAAAQYHRNRNTSFFGGRLL